MYLVGFVTVDMCEDLVCTFCLSVAYRSIGKCQCKCRTLNVER